MAGREAQQAQAATKEFLFKVLVVGDMATGKTAIIRRCVEGAFSDNYKTTIGVDFALKTIKWGSNTLVYLQLWDIAGQERYGNLTRVYYKEAVAAFVVFDLTRNSSFESVKRWKDDIDNKVRLPNGDPLPVILLANKCDMVKTALNEEVMDQYCKENGFISWFATSAKENTNIDESVACIVNHVIKKDEQGAKGDAEAFALNEAGPSARPSSGGCCG